MKKVSAIGYPILKNPRKYIDCTVHVYLQLIKG